MTPTENNERSPEEIATDIAREYPRFDTIRDPMKMLVAIQTFEGLIADAIRSERDKVKTFTLNPDIQELANKLACNVPAGEDAEMFSKARDAIAFALQAERSKRREIVWPDYDETTTIVNAMCSAKTPLGKAAFESGVAWCATWLRSRVEELNRD